MEITLDFLDTELQGIKRQLREMEDKVQHARGAVDILNQLIDYVVKPPPTEGPLMETLTGTDSAAAEKPPESEKEDAVKPGSTTLVNDPSDLTPEVQPNASEPDN